uniref:Putative carnobacteriocin-B2 immunity protein n=2 Tax=Carnobacterium maltaromaticum TaxID=2751 RepID=CB2I_CARML|nr:bacteriocin immunity protein [Carnobacterium maltaromaticum]P38582.1 RecName: Full=Putative carnobacteriocin-B2 immunity protein; AltName: Full=Carnocin-CP52 immunity protein [Carnobacterium maltaromaticum]1TDP_A Chain A, carnobacteriocin B2 immunity protein [Carnobacterium maltaromaticum]AAA72432.1 carnobacteriocin B2 immunity protein [Carnobacterium maltaromaticum]AAB18990.1 putative carnocin CP52 immunity protein [Carnobacterium maltaromaticum]AAB81311.1 carnobacteriocin B2 immunity prot
MDIKSQTLYLNLSEAYKDPEVKANEFLSKLVVQCAGKLTASNSENSYIEVISLLSRGISSYYLSHKRIIPSSMLTIYTQIQKDIKNGNIDTEKLRKYEIAKGLMSVPYIYF